MLSDFDKKVLRVFVTNTEDSIYAIKPNVPSEVFGAFGSYFSRNPKDFRIHLLEAIKGQIEEEKTDVSEEDLKWLVEKQFREPSEAIRRGLAKSQDFFKRWYGKYSHKSIANMVWIPMVGTNVSQLFARELAYDQLAFFIEQSTRFVKFDAENMYHDPDVINSKHAETYKKAIKTLADAYVKFTEEAKNFFKQKIPFEEWMKSQNEETKNIDLKLVERKYEREIDGKTLDVARFLLPQAIRTNIAWILDARSTEYDIAAWKGHPLQEIRDAANMIENNAGQIAPSLLIFTEKNDYFVDKLHGYKRKITAEPAKPFEKGVEIISYDPDAFDKIIALLILKHNQGGTFSQRYEEAKQMNFSEKIAILKRITEKRKRYDEWVEMDEDFDLIKIVFQIRTDVGATRDWRRHQKWDRGEPLYTLDNGYHRPAVIQEMPLEVGELFDNAVKVAHEAEKQIREDFPYQAQYVVPMATNHTITFSSGLDQLQYLIWTRTTPQGNFSYRQDAFNIAEAVVKIYPWLIGYEKYPEGKSFEKIYKEAPLKTIIRIQGWEEGMHE